MVKKNRVFLAGGLGNQLFQLAHALNIPDQPNIILDSNLFFVRKNKSNSIEINDLVLPKRVINARKRKVGLFTKKIANFILRIGGKDSNYFIDKALLIILNLAFRLFATELYFSKYRLLVGKNIGYSHLKYSENNCLIGYFQSYQWVKKSSSASIEMHNLKLLNESEIIGHYQNKSFENPSLGIHVRLGDYKNEKDIGILPDGYYRRALNYYTTFFDLSSIWLFSDEPTSAIRKIPREYHSITHVVDDSLSSAQTLEIMRMCKDIIIANSTFSWWGAYLSHNSKNFVIHPSKWFRNRENPTDLFPLSWHAIKSF